MGDNNYKPAIRFQGFTDAWEQRKLGTVAKFRQGIQVDLDNQYTENADGRERFIRIVDYTQGTDDVRYIDEVENANHVEEDDVVVVRYGATAGFVGRGITGIIANNMFTINPSDCLDKKFLYTFMKQDKMYENLNSSNGSSAMPAINFGIMNNIDISFPNILEQRKIGIYFDNLDNLITLHQRKYDKLISIKKSMLEKMFPQNGETVPEVRFEGFTDAWEQRKFGDIALREALSKESSDDYPFVEYEDVVAEEGRLNKDIRRKEGSKKGIVFDGSQVLYGKLRPYLHNWLNPDFSGVAVGDWWVLKPQNTDKNFIYRLIQTQQFDDVANQSAGSKMPRADWNLVSNTEFAIPTSQDEQEKIGVYFDNLDNLITLHQRKLEKLKYIKKAMLEKMFV